jgi:hypothetical protein
VRRSRTTNAAAPRDASGPSPISTAGVRPKLSRTREAFSLVIWLTSCWTWTRVSVWQSYPRTRGSEMAALAAVLSCATGIEIDVDSLERFLIFCG